MKLKQMYGRFILQFRLNKKVAGWGMMADEATIYIKGLGKTVLTLFGYSSHYEDEKAMLETSRSVLSQYSPETTLINIGATRGGLGAIYPLAKSLKFTTTGIVSSLALDYPGEISADVDRICFIADSQWGGNLPNSNTLSPTSQAMVDSSDVLVGIGGGEIVRDEMLAGQKLGKPTHFYPADINHAWLIKYCQRRSLPPPASFKGAAHEAFAKDEN
ncbi:MAG: hypothetical protein HYZ23_02420 [Chloroflexi bacterium]|nr:hypothetical protein [Chloroflexota bacterium]